jgi:hypothetical protein
MAFVVWEQPTSEAFERETLRGQSPKHPEPKECLASLKSLCPRDLKTYYTWRLCIFQSVRRRVMRIQESLWIAGERSLWRFGSLPWRLTRVIGRGLSVLSSRGIRWRRGLLSSITASLTRRTVVTATGTGLPNPCLRQATGSITLPFTYSFASWSHCLLALFDFTVWSHSFCLHVWLHTVFLVWSTLPSCCLSSCLLCTIS